MVVWRPGYETRRVQMRYQIPYVTPTTFNARKTTAQRDLASGPERLHIFKIAEQRAASAQLNRFHNSQNNFSTHKRRCMSRPDSTWAEVKTAGGGPWGSYKGTDGPEFGEVVIFFTDLLPLLQVLFLHTQASSIYFFSIIVRGRTSLHITTPHHHHITNLHPQPIRRINFPPPPHLPLLSPILRSRLQHLSGTSETFLPLLTWSTQSPTTGESLLDHLRDQDFTPHPSGELEVSDAELLGLRRIDTETLEARVILHERGLLVRYVWTTNDTEGEKDGWKVLEVQVSQAGKLPAEEKWVHTIWEAEEDFALRQRKAAGISLTTTTTAAPAVFEQHQQEEEDDDDAYWSRYDQEESESAPPSPARETSEDDYYSRYDQVSPSLEDPAFDVPQPNYTPPSYEPQPRIFAPFPTTHSTDHLARLEKKVDTLSPPETEPSETSSRPVSLFNAASLNGGGSMKGSVKEEDTSVLVEQGIRMHVSASIKSLYRLAMAGGIERGEFERMVLTEVGCLGMLEGE
ncbi:hypothetical protein BJ508DRAFT_308061 [Ascobolus immersus RN42]|uniref:Uncharacterized protein n=1 Tax=Ascobolus immersus RN42 TaxID=1160509 RepID=A0A3N4I0X3_ASCIM|nr:hypothetical protein BJ508DRAFT_308061 [Ascobolus immersus RN42]